MTTTEPQPSVYAVLAQLPDAEVDGVLAELVDQVRNLTAEVAPVVTAARRALEAHNRRAADVVERTIEQTGMEHSDEDGLYRLIDYLSGASGLNIALTELRDLCDPDTFLKD